jgi:hypothetical protein
MAGMTDPAWQLKVVGDTQKYTQGEGNEVSYAVNIVRSLRWPGAVTVAKNGKFTNIYVGNGIKKGDAPMFPTEPPVVQKEPEDAIEEPEPTPKNAPPEPAEPDTDEEQKEEEEDEQ